MGGRPGTDPARAVQSVVRAWPHPAEAAPQKRLDHADFFTRAKGKIVSGLLDEFRVLHLRDPFDLGYRAFRDDLAADVAFLRSAYPGR